MVMDMELLDYEIPPCKRVFEYLQVSHALETGVLTAVSYRYLFIG